MVPYTYDVRCVRQFAGEVDARTGQPVAVVNVNVGQKEGRKEGRKEGGSASQVILALLCLSI